MAKIEVSAEGVQHVFNDLVHKGKLARTVIQGVMPKNEAELVGLVMADACDLVDRLEIWEEDAAGKIAREFARQYFEEVKKAEEAIEEIRKNR